jgi:DNA replication protein DnaC
MILDLFRKEIEFENIQGYDDIKDIVKRALDAEENYNLLFIGPPASAKTLFLLGIMVRLTSIKKILAILY